MTEMSEANEDGQPGEDGKPTKKRRICGVNTLEPCTKDRIALSGLGEATLSPPSARDRQTHTHTLSLSHTHTRTLYCRSS